MKYRTRTLQTLAITFVYTSLNYVLVEDNLSVFHWDGIKQCLIYLKRRDVTLF